MKNEQIDELIDRVAAELVEGADNPSLAAQLRQRLQVPQRTVPSALLFAVAVGAVVVLAVAFNGNGTQSTSTNETLTNAGTVAAPARRATTAPAAPLAPLAPLAPEKLLVILPLEVAALDEITFDVAPLEVEALTVAELEDAEKEPR